VGLGGDSSSALLAHSGFSAVYKATLPYQLVLGSHVLIYEHMPNGIDEKWWGRWRTNNRDERKKKKKKKRLKKFEK
jgi:hypothetical protein